MEDEPVLREALSRRDAALSEARRLDDFIRLYNELRGPHPKLTNALHTNDDDEFILEKTRGSVR